MMKCTEFFFRLLVFGNGNFLKAKRIREMPLTTFSLCLKFFRFLLIFMLIFT
jgi:hypothetical protein